MGRGLLGFLPVKKRRSTGENQRQYQQFDALSTFGVGQPQYTTADGSRTASVSKDRALPAVSVKLTPTQRALLFRTHVLMVVGTIIAFMGAVLTAGWWDDNLGVEIFCMVLSVLGAAAVYNSSRQAIQVTGWLVSNFFLGRSAIGALGLLAEESAYWQNLFATVLVVSVVAQIVSLLITLYNFKPEKWMQAEGMLIVVLVVLLALLFVSGSTGTYLFFLAVLAVVCLLLNIISNHRVISLIRLKETSAFRLSLPLVSSAVSLFSAIAVFFATAARVSRIRSAIRGGAESTSKTAAVTTVA